MYHHSSHDEQHNHNHHDQILNTIIDGLRDRQISFKRDQIINSLLEDAPKSFTKLLSKDTISRQFTSQQRIRSSKKYPVNTNLIEARSKHTQKNFYKVLEEEHRLINRQNMQLLGLTIQRIGYASKNKKTGTTDNTQNIINNIQPTEVLNFDNAQNTPQDELFLDKRGVTHHRSRELSKRPQSIRVRGKDSNNSTERRRSSIKPTNIEYQNPIYQARIFSYRQLLFKMQWSYGHFAEMDRQQQLKSDKRYKAWIGGGNNSPLVRELIKRRFWWQITQDKTNLEVNFIWTQLKLAEYFKKQTSAPMWFISENLKNVEQLKKITIREQGKQLFFKSKQKKEKEKESLKDEQFLFKIMPQYQILSYQNAIRPYRNKNLYQKQRLLNLKQQNSQNDRMHNHLTNNFHLGNKKALFYNLKQYYDLTGGNLFKSIPLTFHIKKGINDPQYKRFLAYYKKRQAHINRQQRQEEKGQSCKRKMRNIWIVKPGELTNRGNGITVIDQVYELDAIIKSQKKHENGSDKTFIVQLYIDRPFLYKKRKFDIRHYLMITQIHGLFKAFWFKQGYIRTASYQFDIHNLEREIHLTNDAVQKYTPLYGRYEPANKVSYSQFQKYLDTSHPKEKYNFEEQILPKMKNIALDAVRSTFLKVSPERYKHNFEVFGLDFMIDSEFQPWLIQVNTNPCLELVCPLLTRIIPQMLDQALRLSLDVVFPPPTHYPNTAKHLVPDSSLESLRWQLIFDERVEGKQLRQHYRGCKNDLLAAIGDVSDDQVYEDTSNQPITLQELL